MGDREIISETVSAAGEKEKKNNSLLKLSSSSVLLVPGLMYLKGAINADSMPTFSVGETRDMQSQQQAIDSDVFTVLSIKASDQHHPNTLTETRRK